MHDATGNQLVEDAGAFAVPNLSGAQHCIIQDLNLVELESKHFLRLPQDLA